MPINQKSVKIRNLTNNKSVPGIGYAKTQLWTHFSTQMETTAISEQQSQRKLDKPANLTFVEASENTITVTWSAVASRILYD